MRSEISLTGAFSYGSSGIFQSAGAENSAELALLGPTEKGLTMLRHSLPLLALLTSLAGTATLSSPATAADPVCIPGFFTAQKTSWLLVCQKTVPMAQKGVALTQAGNAVCTTEPYWNFGPKVEAKAGAARGTVKVIYTCGHVEG